nr:origin of replication complex subunit 3 isoform X1 [Tanacetum cinerariifolium]
MTDEPHNITEASVQARFCRAVTELQITGLLRMPSKRRLDFVQRVAFIETTHDEVSRCGGEGTATPSRGHVRFERAEVYYECMEPFKSLMCLWVRNRSTSAIWLEKVVTPLIVPAIKVEFRRISLTGFRSCISRFQTGASQSRQIRIKYFGRLCPSEIYRIISLALDSISALLLFGDRRLERTATFSISTISE